MSMIMTMFERSKRARNRKEGYPEDKGLKNGHCNRSGCLAPLEGQPHWWMIDHETFTDARLYYCQVCADQFTAWDRHIGAPIRCTLEEPTNG
ncbi:hypothetical protein [Bradyrhizobium phage BDU-MI-1]|nr:hypothetical protein [Bradyrhizobium phage BDU-MI-1]